MNQFVVAPDEIGQEDGYEEKQIEILATELAEVISSTGAALPEKYRSIIPKTLIVQRENILAETGKILDALGLQE